MHDRSWGWGWWAAQWFAAGVGWLVGRALLILLVLAGALALLFVILIVRWYLQNRLSPIRRVWARVHFMRTIQTNVAVAEGAENVVGIAAAAASATPVGIVAAAAEAAGAVLKPPGSDNPVDYWITFVLPDGRRLELSASQDDYLAIQQDQEGWLTYQGEWLRSFEPAAQSASQSG